MRSTDDGHNGWRWRVGWAAMTSLLAETVLLAVSAWPAFAGVRAVARTVPSDRWFSDLVVAATLAPAYLLFAVLLAISSALATRVLGWRTPADTEVRLRDYPWPVLDWARYLISIHVVRLFLGTPFRSTPLWTMYLRLNGARIGRGCWVNSLRIMDHNLLDIGDGAVIGARSSVSAHIVDHGRFATAPIALGRGVTIGVGAVVGIGAVLDDDVQVGALSVVPKHAHLTRGVWVGAPVRRVESAATSVADTPTPRDTSIDGRD